VKTYGRNYVYWSSLPNYLAALLVYYPLFQLQYDFVKSLRIGGLQRNEEIFARSSNMYCLFTKYHWSEVEKLLK
jgi:hypothetical protein